MKSSIAAPCFRNSGLLTTLNGCVVSAAIAARTFGAVPTGTVLLSTTTVYLFIARPMSRATPSTCCRSAAPSSPCGVPTAMNTMSEATDRGWQVGREGQALFALVADDHLLEARLVDRHPPGLERRDLRLILIDAHDGVSVFGEAGTQDEPDIPGSDDGDFHFTIRY